MSKPITWFELPAENLERAVAFYEQVLGEKLEVSEMGGNPYAFFPHSDEGIGGAITVWPDFHPAKEGGPMVYFFCDNIEQALEKVHDAGGKISTPKALISDQVGHYATIIDSEGNKVALHEPPQRGGQTA